MDGAKTIRKELKNCLKMSNTKFNNVQIHNWKIRIRRDFLKCNLEDLLLLSNKTTQKQSKFIEVSSSQYTNVFKCGICVDGINYSLYLKQYLYRSVWDFLKHLFRPSPAKRSFDASIMLQKAGLDAPVVIGLFEKWAGPFLIQNLLLTKEVENAKSVSQCLTDMSRISSKNTLIRKRNLIECFGKTVGQMHAKGIFHGDLRLGNILAQRKGETWRFFFIDNERTKQFLRLPIWLRLKNLVQLNMFMNGLTNADRMRFFKYYLNENANIRHKYKRIAKKVATRAYQRLKAKHPDLVVKV